MNGSLKKYLTGAVSGMIAAAVTVAAAALPAAGNDERLGRYDLDTYLYPIWDGGAVYQETLVFYEDAEGNVRDNTLLYTPDTILCVRSFGLNTVYEEGKDYTVTGNVIHRTGNSDIPVMPRSAYCRAEDRSTAPQLLDSPDGGYLISDNTVMQKYYLSVSYLHTDTYGGRIPRSEPAQLPVLREKLEKKEPVRIAVLGDSIAAGYSASGLNEPSYNTKGEKITVKVNTAPFMPPWYKMAEEMLRKAYGYEDITVLNMGVGGTNTNSACLPDMIGRVTDSDPDLVIVGFGMNEFWAPANQHADRIEGVCDRIHEKCPDAGFLLLSSMQPNRIARDPSTFHFREFEEAYEELRDRRTDLSVAVAPLNSVYTYICDIKGDFSMVGGNNNHPNDFTVRLYAETVLAVLGVYDIYDFSGIPDSPVTDSPDDGTGTAGIAEDSDAASSDRVTAAPESEPAETSGRNTGAAVTASRQSILLTAAIAAAAVILTVLCSVWLTKEYCKKKYGKN